MNWRALLVLVCPHGTLSASMRTYIRAKPQCQEAGGLGPEIHRPIREGELSQIPQSPPKLPGRYTDRSSSMVVLAICAA